MSHYNKLTYGNAGSKIGLILWFRVGIKAMQLTNFTQKRINW